MRLTTLLKPEHSWFIDLLHCYHLEVYCIGLQHQSWISFYRSSIGGESIAVWDIPLDSQILDTPVTLDGINDLGIQIIIQCKVTQKMLGLLYSTPSTPLIGGIVDRLASMRSVLNQLYPKNVGGPHGEMGTKIGSLLLTSYSLFLLSQTQVNFFRLLATQAAKCFYQNIKMHQVLVEELEESPEDQPEYFEADILPWPVREYYEKLMTPQAIIGKGKKILVRAPRIKEWTTRALEAQRLFRSKKIMQLCSNVKQLITELKARQLNRSIDLQYIALNNLIQCLEHPSTIGSDAHLVCYRHTRDEIKTEIRKILRMSFIEPYKSISLVQSIMTALEVK